MIEPEWVKVAIEAVRSRDNAAAQVDAILGLAKTIGQNADGLVVHDYNILTDTNDWVFGTARWQRLIDPATGHYYPDDPLNGHQDPITLAKFMAYLNDWYWPRHLGQLKPPMPLSYAALKALDAKLFAFSRSPI